MNHVDEKPKKPGWFVFVESLVSFVLLGGLLLLVKGLASGLTQLGVPPLFGLALSVAGLGLLIHGVILRYWKPRK